MTNDHDELKIIPECLIILAMSYQLDIIPPADPEFLSGLEWIETNGTGGWASSTVSGMNTRRYHGLLIAGDPQDPSRVSQVSRLDETLMTPDENVELGSNNYGNAVNPKGYRYLTRFSRDIFPEFIYEGGGITLKKTIAAINGENTTVIRYEVLKALGTFTLRLAPFITCRDYHALVRSNPAIRKELAEDPGYWHVIPYQTMPEIFFHMPGFSFKAGPSWYYNIQYPVEAARGMDFTEDLFTYGNFDRQLKQGDTLVVMLSSGQPASAEGEVLLAKEKNRRLRLLKGAADSLEKTLRLAADQFIIRMGGGAQRIIAGYHWFTSWGRDTMIALNGLCLSTGRFSEAGGILMEFIRHISEGMLPNRFADHQSAPDYNTADASLWFFITGFRYFEATGDKDFLVKVLMPAFKSIIDWHYQGTRYHIHVDQDGLLFEGEEGMQLTWMDARSNGRVVTPRIGKAVEINALWYNALMIYSGMLKETGDKVGSVDFQLRAATMKVRFLELFWNADAQCLYDVVNGTDLDSSLRPNQLLAISLPFPLLGGAAARQVLDLVTEKLYTPRGIRSLAPEDPAYHDHYTGGQAARDEAYHEGTVWSWLLGPYIDAIMYVYPRRGQKMAREVLDTFRPHLEEAGIGSVSEIFDGDSPFTPRGCIAQAWSIGELLRVYTAYKLHSPAPATKKKIKQTV